MNCRISNKPLNLINDFGNQPLGNGFLDKQDFKNEYFYHMKTGFCKESKMFQLIDQPNMDKMFHENYAFFSSLSTNMKKHFYNWANEIMSDLNKKKEPFIVELGCNDGIFLEHFAENKINHLGIEPSVNVAKEAEKKNINVVTKFFKYDVANEIVNDFGHADYFISANVMCHIPNILEVARGIEKILKKDGLLIFEDPYLGDVLKRTTYDQIYDEHVFLFSAHSIKYLFEKVGMELVKLEPQDTHGGSMRYTLGKKGVHNIDHSVIEVIKKEIDEGVDNYDKMLEFSKNVEQNKIALVKILKDISNKNHKICGYAATSKSTTILNYCNIDENLIDCIFDTTKLKIGKFSPGKHIPIRDMKEFNHSQYKFAVLFAWNHATEIFQKEKKFSENNGKWINFSSGISII